MEGAYLHTYTQTSFPQCPPVLEGQINTQPSDVLPFPQDPQFRGEGNQVFPFIRPSDSMYQMTFPRFIPSTLTSKGYRVAVDQATSLVDVDDASRGSCKGHIPMNTSSNQGHQYAPVDTVHDFSASSNFPTISHTPIPVQYQQQSASQYAELGRFQKSSKGHPATTSQSYRRKPGTRRAPKGPHSCDICGNTYAQPQGVTRHRREAHQVSVCTYCHKFRWGRPYQLRKHLKEQHPNVDPGTVLGPIGSRRSKVTEIPKCSPRQRVSTLEHDRRGRDEPSLCPPALVSSEMEEVTLLSPSSVMSSLDYDPQPKPVEPVNTTQGHEDPHDSIFDVTYTAVVSPEFFQQTDDLETDSQNERIWYRNEGQSSCQDESATTNNQSTLHHIPRQRYRLSTDMMAAQSSFLWPTLLDPLVLHSSVQGLIDPASLSPRCGLPRRH